jgi:hypothetical protein
MEDNWSMSIGLLAGTVDEESGCLAARAGQRLLGM